MHLCTVNWMSQWMISSQENIDDMAIDVRFSGDLCLEVVNKLDNVLANKN